MILLFDAVYLELLAVSLRNHHQHRHQNNNNNNNDDDNDNNNNNNNKKISVVRPPLFLDVTY
jgi:Ca2+/H+ antiporter